MNKYWLFLFFAVAISSTSQILLKKGASKQHNNVILEYLNPWVISGYGLMILSTFCVIYAYRGVEYKNGAIIESLGFFLVMFMSRIFLNERITAKKIIGNLIILAGIMIFYM